MSSPRACAAKSCIPGKLAREIACPTKSNWSAGWASSRETVRMALRLLDAEGLTTTSQGRSGVRIRHPEPERVARWFEGLTSYPDRRDLGRPVVVPNHARTRRGRPRRHARHTVATQAHRRRRAGGHRTRWHRLSRIPRAAGRSQRKPAPHNGFGRDRTGSALGRGRTKHHSVRSRRGREVASRDCGGRLPQKTPSGRSAAWSNISRPRFATWRSRGFAGAPMIPPSRWRGENSELPWR